jgi:hypothetical protein
VQGAHRSLMHAHGCSWWWRAHAAPPFHGTCRTCSRGTRRLVGAELLEVFSCLMVHASLRYGHAHAFPHESHTDIGWHLCIGHANRSLYQFKIAGESSSISNHCYT